MTIDGMQFGCMPGKRTMDAASILRRIQEECIAKQMKSYVCFVYLEKASAQSSKESRGMGKEKVWNSRSI